MRDAGRIAAAIEVLTAIETRHLTVRRALKAWGDDARYAGAKDRAFVSGLVLDVLRKQRSLAWRMKADTVRAKVLAALCFVWHWPSERIAEAASDSAHGPGALSEDETEALEGFSSPVPHGGGGPPSGGGEAPSAPIAGDYPDWLDVPLARIFGEARVAETSALATRAPVDLRINTLRTDEARALKALAPLGVRPAGVMRHALRIAAPAAEDRTPSVEAVPEFAKGWFEVQDLGSQIAAAAAGEIKGRQVMDFCAGGGGKTLALAAAMGNSGQLYAYDSDARRLTETVTRSQRAGVRNLQVRSPLQPDALTGLEMKMDVVFVDAPCTGSGTWRRHPDAKWRLTPAQLEQRQADQDAVLNAAQAFVKPGGRLVYVTCSLLMEENEDRVAAFLVGHADFAQTSTLAQIAASGLADGAALDALEAREATDGAIRLSPFTFGTDGFFVAVLQRAK
jgi:16S rRNA (cytosine967-C5)-methyltransferase